MNEKMPGLASHKTELGGISPSLSKNNTKTNNKLDFLFSNPNSNSTELLINGTSGIGEEFRVINDSGCLEHAFKDLEYFKYLGPPTRSGIGTAKDGDTCPIAGTGIVELAVTGGGTTTIIEIAPVHYIPALAANITSPFMLRNLQGWSIDYEDPPPHGKQNREIWTIPQTTTKMKATVRRTNPSYHVYWENIRPVNKHATCSFMSKYDKAMWAHRCLGHLPMQEIRKMHAKGILDDLQLTDEDLKPKVECGTCIEAGTSSFQFTRYRQRRLRKLHLQDIAAEAELENIMTSPDTTKFMEEGAKLRSHTTNLFLEIHPEDKDPHPQTGDHPIKYLSVDAFGPLKTPGVKGEKDGWVIQTIEDGKSYGMVLASRDRSKDTMLKLIKLIHCLEDSSGGKVKGADNVMRIIVSLPNK